MERNFDNLASCGQKWDWLHIVNQIYAKVWVGQNKPFHKFLHDMTTSLLFFLFLAIYTESEPAYASRQT